MSADDDDMLRALERRISELEKLGEHYSDPQNQRLDNLLRKFARSLEMTAWLGGLCIRVAPIVALVWWFGDEAIKWALSFLSQGASK